MGGRKEKKLSIPHNRNKRTRIVLVVCRLPFHFPTLTSDANLHHHFPSPPSKTSEKKKKTRSDRQKYPKENTMIKSAIHPSTNHNAVKLPYLLSSYESALSGERSNSRQKHSRENI